MWEEVRFRVAGRASELLSLHEMPRAFAFAVRVVQAPEVSYLFAPGVTSHPLIACQYRPHAYLLSAIKSAMNATQLKPRKFLAVHLR